MTANDTQVGGAHYAADYQHWDLVADTEMSYFSGQITKYVIRHKKKHGLQDLEKSRHFAQKYLEVIRPRSIYAAPSTPRVEAYLRRFFKTNPHLGLTEQQIVAVLAHNPQPEALQLVLRLLGSLIEEYEASEPGTGYVNQS